jgi:hypothetical protein
LQVAAENVGLNKQGTTSRLFFAGRAKRLPPLLSVYLVIGSPGFALQEDPDELSDELRLVFGLIIVHVHLCRR